MSPPGIIEEWRRGGHLRPLEAQFASLIERRCGALSTPAALAICTLLRLNAEGHVQLPLARFADSAPLEHMPSLRAPSLEACREALAACPAVGAPGDYRPLVLDRQDRLYLHRYWSYERAVARRLGQLAAAEPQPIGTELARALVGAFAPGPGGDHGQRIAAAVALSRRLCVISGGPGTGKTATAVRVLGLLAAHCRGERVALAAPTGKAASRLQESALAVGLQVRAFTLHRLLGLRAGGGAPRHDHARPLDFDRVVVDEASMVDLELMARLLDALPAGARLLLLGDRDQLASVDAGAVLGDLCAGARGPSGPWRRRLAAIADCEVPGGDAAQPPIGDCVVLLGSSRRFAAEGAIAMLARSVCAGDADAALELLEHEREDLVWHRGGDVETLTERICGGFRQLRDAAAAAADPVALLAALGRWRVLCAHRRGRFGAEALAARVESRLRQHAGWHGAWYPGRAVMVVRNAPDLELYNGDVGVVAGAADGRLEVCFEGPGGSPRMLTIARLPAIESALVNTVHKAQGTEFDRALLVLPPEPSSVLTRELVYTAITRARHGVEIWGSEAVLRAAIAGRVERASGLSEALWGEAR